MTQEVLVDVQDVSYQYAESPGCVEHVTLQIRRGERLLLLGKNGSGKSTILSLIAGKRKAKSGRVSVLGSDAFDDTRLNLSVSLVGVPWPPEAYFNTTVMSIASPAPDLERRRHIAQKLHLPLHASIDTMSAGEKRRVQVLHGMLRVPQVLLLDECSTEIDVAERRTVLQLAAAETEKGACCVYATHILDGVEEWATRVVLVEKGRVVRDESFSLELGRDKLLAHLWLAKQSFRPFSPLTQYPLATDSAPVIVAKHLDFRHRAASPFIFKDCNMSVPHGSRTLLVGCNGSGKTTLLRLIGGKVFFANRDAELTVSGHRCFQDVKATNEAISYGGDWWAQVPGGEVHAGELICCPLTQYAESVRVALNVDLSWDVRYVSAGERKRIQLFLALSEPTPVVLLDEATADLDLDMRHILLHFLHRASVERGVTVVYATHIFEGLEDWATDCIIVDRTTKGVHLHLRAPDIALTDVVQTLYKLKDNESWYQEDH